jgi:4-hydroxybenzoate polyprenyltransferase
MAVAPVGGWIAAGGGEASSRGCSAGDRLWVGGFDILYACQDLDFDRGTVCARSRRASASRARSAVARDARRDGRRDGALWRVRASARSTSSASPSSRVLLAYEQSLVSDDDLSQVKKAFDLNGYVGIVYFLATALSSVLHSDERIRRRVRRANTSS